MFNSYSPYSTPAFGYGAPSYSHGRPDREYLRALAEEEAARRQYAEALRAQEEARNRAARARFARHAYEAPHNSFLDEEYDDDRMYGYGYPSRSRHPSAAATERQRLAAFERERQRELERVRALEEEREMRKQLLEEERRRRLMIEEEGRRLQKEAEERERRRLEREFFRRQPSRSPQSSPLEDILGLRPAQVRETVSIVYLLSTIPCIDNSFQPLSRRGRTTSPVQRPETAHSVPVQRTASRSSPQESTPINIHVPTRSPSPSTSIPTKQANASPSPRPKLPQPPSEREVEAAIKIQTTWRDHHARRTALQSIAELGAKFIQLKDTFALPASLDFSTGPSVHDHTAVPTSGIDVESVIEESDVGKDVPKLAYTPTNAPLHAYYEELSRILTKLDGVQSGGDHEIRAKRRELARHVEREAERIERLRAPVWRAWVKHQEESMVVDNEEQTATPVSLPMTAVVEKEEPTFTIAGDLPEASTSLKEDLPSSDSALEPVQFSLPSDNELAEGEDSSTSALVKTDAEPMDTTAVGCPMVDVPTSSASSDTFTPLAPSVEDTSASTSEPSSLPSPLVVDHHSDDDGEPSSSPQTPNTVPFPLPVSSAHVYEDVGDAQTAVLPGLG